MRHVVIAAGGVGKFVVAQHREQAWADFLAASKVEGAPDEAQLPTRLDLEVVEPVIGAGRNRVESRTRRIQLLRAVTAVLAAFRRETLRIERSQLLDRPIGFNRIGDDVGVVVALTDEVFAIDREVEQINVRRTATQVPESISLKRNIKAVEMGGVGYIDAGHRGTGTGRFGGFGLGIGCRC